MAVVDSAGGVGVGEAPSKFRVLYEVPNLARGDCDRIRIGRDWATREEALAEAVAPSHQPIALLKLGGIPSVELLGRAAAGVGAGVPVLQGLADYLRSQAQQTLNNCDRSGVDERTQRSVDCLRQWAREVDAARGVQASEEALPRCRTCNDYRTVLSPGKGNETEPCPDCAGGVTEALPPNSGPFTMAQMLAFLHGEAPLDGVWFGEMHPGQKGAFWWRKFLRAAGGVGVPVPPGFIAIQSEPTPELYERFLGRVLLNMDKPHYERWSRIYREVVEALGVAVDVGAAPPKIHAWPKDLVVGRMGDMGPPGRTHMTVMLDGDSDALVSIWQQEQENHGQLASIEFCTGFGGGGSPRTRAALIALMVAMEADNAEAPRKRWPPADRAAARVPEGAFFRPEDIAKAVMTPEEEATVRRCCCPKCIERTLGEPVEGGGVAFRQCSRCKTVYAAGVQGTVPDAWLKEAERLADDALDYAEDLGRRAHESREGVRERLNAKRALLLLHVSGGVKGGVRG